MDSTYLGPFFSGGGCHTWDCWLSPQSIIAIRHKLWRMLRVTAWQHLGFPADPQHPPAEHHPQDRVYGIEQVQAVTVKHKALSHNEVLITLANGTVHVYGIFDRRRTDECREKLFLHYPHLYQDVGFGSPIPTERSGTSLTD